MSHTMPRKSQSEQALSSSSLEEVNSKINKITLETAKSISRVELLVKESVSEIKK